MCGIAGLVSLAQAQSLPATIPGFEGLSGESLLVQAQAMAQTLKHRGPDDAGLWTDRSLGLALAHQRLSIVDLSPAGHQPMISEDGRWVMIFNGEIYNHLALRSMLDAQGLAPSRWVGHSDTETLLACIQAWGLHRALTQAIGMFALVLWCQRTQTLFFARDRIGEKPLYLGWVQGSKHRPLALAFASELKAIEAVWGFANPICPKALAHYLRLGYVPAPFAIYEHVYKLPPGHVLSLPLQTLGRALTQDDPLAALFNGPLAGQLAQSHHPNEAVKAADEGSCTLEARLSCYWSFATLWAPHAGASLPPSPPSPPSTPATTVPRDASEAVEALDQCLREAVQKQMIADVPLGAFLSGGVDSSTIVALMQAQSALPIQTFTIGFDEPGFDESPHAQAVAQHLKTDHRCLRVTSEHARDVIATLPTMYDEPFADSSQIPTHLVAKLAREHVTVALSGDAGDELFGGYNRYTMTPPLWKRVGWVPFALRKVLGHGLEAIPVGAWDGGFSLASQLRGKAFAVHAGEKVHKMAARLKRCESFDAFAQSFEYIWPPDALPLSPWAKVQTPGLTPAQSHNPPHAPVQAPSPSHAWYAPEGPWPLPDSSCPRDPVARMMAKDSMGYLPDDILCKVDRAAMAVSLETRVPFLDHRVVEFAWQLPQHLKIRNGQGKWILRQVLDRYVPRTLIERPKAGFGIPVGQWLRGPLRAWAEELLESKQIAAQGYLDPEAIQAIWRAHQSARADHTPKLWTVLMFQAWLRERPHLQHDRRSAHAVKIASW